MVEGDGEMINEEELRTFLFKWCIPSQDESVLGQFRKDLEKVFE